MTETDCDHAWDGELEDFDEDRRPTLTCSRCGAWAVAFAARLVEAAVR